jgi:hypothetical protein
MIRNSSVKTINVIIRGFIKRKSSFLKTTSSRFYCYNLHLCSCDFSFSDDNLPAFKDSLFQLEYQQVHYGYQDQGQNCSEQQAENHRPGQRTPECDVITTKENVGIKFGKQRGSYAFLQLQQWLRAKARPASREVR